MNMLKFTIKKTQMRLAREMILDFYSQGVKDWGDFIKHFDELDSRADKQKPISSTQADDDLAAWLENMKLEEGEDEQPHMCSHPKISTNNVALYRCSWCGNPSAVLRKCGGCGRARCVLHSAVAVYRRSRVDTPCRYCDGQCQKKHWSEHRADCKGK